MIPQPIDPHGDPCQLAVRWGISLELARRLQQMAGDVPFSVSIISGARTAEAQDELGSLPACNTGARPCSTHTTCPATGADVWPGVAVVPAVKAHLGRAAVYAGLRWGGGSPIDPESGIPADWNHLDLGRVT